MNDHIWLVLLLFVIEILLIVVIACFKILAKRVNKLYILYFYTIYTFTDYNKNMNSELYLNYF